MAPMALAALLGLIQALTEFLPVSSSGHLRLAHSLLGLNVTFDLFFDIVLHVGTLVAVFFVYRDRIAHLLAGVARGIAALPGGMRNALEAHEGLRYLALLIIATLPTGVIGVLLSDVVDSDIFSVPIVGGLLLFNGVILWTSKRWSYEDPVDTPDGAPRDGLLSVGGISWRDALIIGIAQGVAVLPGISRAGCTIVCALALGSSRMRAAEFSFFLSIPAILGAVVLKLDPEALSAADFTPGPYIVGAVVSAVAGVMALTLLLNVVRKARMHQFAWYCWALGLVAIISALI